LKNKLKKFFSVASVRISFCTFLMIFFFSLAMFVGSRIVGLFF
jgi:hypothetical protein